MALKTCPECKREVSTTADACPHCGFSFTKQAKQKASLISSLVVIGLCGALYYWASSSPSQQPAPATTEPTPPAPLTAPSSNSDSSQAVSNDLGPLPSGPCPDYLPRKYKNRGWFEELAIDGDIAQCAHASVSNVQAFIHAYMQTTGDPDGSEAVQALINFSNNIIQNPRTQGCLLKSIGVKPRDENGQWRDSVDLLNETALAIKNATVAPSAACLDTQTHDTQPTPSVEAPSPTGFPTGKSGSQNDDDESCKPPHCAVEATAQQSNVAAAPVVPPAAKSADITSAGSDPNGCWSIADLESRSACEAKVGLGGTFPVYDVNAFCNGEYSGPNAETNKCISEEQLSYNVLEGVWPTLHARVKETVLAFYTPLVKAWQSGRGTVWIYSATLEYERGIEQQDEWMHPDEYKQSFQP